MTQLNEVISSRDSVSELSTKETVKKILNLTDNYKLLAETLAFKLMEYDDDITKLKADKYKSIHLKK